MVTGKCTDFSGGFFWLGESWGEGYVEDLSMEELLMGEETFNGGAQGFLALFKKQWKNKYEKFFLLKVRSSSKTENEQTL